MASARSRRSSSKSTRTPDPIRYAVVGLGHIAQVAVLPAFRNARKNSVLTALVSDDPRKRQLLAKRHRVPFTFGYDEYERCLEQVDAVYVALPNSMHAEYTIRAARAGVHVLCEKPLAVTTDECERMIEACREAGVKLMVAYRLHFEALNLEAVELARSGRLGDLRYFNSSFSMRLRSGNIRARRELGGGSLYDIGVYCINAARYLFRAEPVEVMAMSVHSGASALREVDESTGAMLRFDRGRLAVFVTSFNAADVAAYRIAGTKGHVRIDPAYEYAEGLSGEVAIDGKVRRLRGPKRDQFAPELLYFSDCVLRNREPEPSGVEGLQDVRIVQALYESAETGRPVALAPLDTGAHPTARQRVDVPAIRKQRLVKARSASA